MNDRERLVKLLRQAADVVTHSPGASTWGAVSDHLISHGVTIQKHGRWIEETDFLMDVEYKCSVCNELFCTIDGTPFDNLYNYCPNCGAKMDGEDDAD